MTKIALFDPSLGENQGKKSSNLGDLIIFESIEKHLESMFKELDMTRISSHYPPRRDQLEKAMRAEYMFFGGTNILSSDLKKYNQWKLSIPHRLWWPTSFPIHDVILMGVGWWQYQGHPSSYTRSFYKRALSKNYIHSVRDQYTASKLRQLGFDNVIYTGCPTMWMLDGLNVEKTTGPAEHCIFTLTDYMKAPALDNKLIQTISDSYKGNIFFFPQGQQDLPYITSLSNYKKNQRRITILNNSLESYSDTLNNKEIDYIGTRLHTGIKALQLGKNALILSVDNRASEIAKDTGLPVLPRDNEKAILAWIKGNASFGQITMPTEEIALWKQQFQ